MRGWRILSCSRQAFLGQAALAGRAPDDHVQIDPLGDLEDTMRGIG